MERGLMQLQFHQIHRPAQQGFELALESEISAQCAAVDSIVKFDDEIGVTARIEEITTHDRAEGVQAGDSKLRAYFRNPILIAQ